MANVSMDDMRKLKVADLKKVLKDRGLGISGTKDVLLERLQAALGSSEKAEDMTKADGALDESVDQIVVQGTPAASSALPVEITAPSVVPSKENIPEEKAVSDLNQKKNVSSEGMSEAEKLKARAEKFGGVVSDSTKKLMRAERFGLTTPSAGSSKIESVPTTAADLDKMKKRAERFGMVVSNKLSKVDEDERKRKRLERFGNAVSAPSDEKKVKLNSTSSDIEEKKKKRAERFGLT